MPTFSDQIFVGVQRTPGKNALKVCVELGRRKCSWGKNVIDSELFNVTSTCLGTLSERGYYVTDTVIDDDLEREMLEAGRHQPTPMMSHRMNDFTAANSRWVILRFDGALVGTLGFRFDDLGSKSLAEYLEALFRRHFQSTNTSTQIRRDAPKRIFEVSGPNVHAGDFWFHPDHRGDPAKTMCFCNYAHSLVFAQWQSAAFMYAFHWRRHALAGKVDQYGFVSGSIPGAQIWTNPPPGREDTEQLSLLSRDDWRSQLSYLVKHPQELTDPPILRRMQDAPKRILKSSI